MLRVLLLLLHVLLLHEMLLLLLHLGRLLLIGRPFRTRCACLRRRPRIC